MNRVERISQSGGPTRGAADPETRVESPKVSHAHRTSRVRHILAFFSYAVSWLNRCVERLVEWHVRGYVPPHLTPAAMKRYGVWL